MPLQPKEEEDGDTEESWGLEDDCLMELPDYNSAFVNQQDEGEEAEEAEELPPLPDEAELAHYNEVLFLLHKLDVFFVWQVALSPKEEEVDEVKVEEASRKVEPTEVPAPVKMPDEEFEEVLEARVQFF